MFETKESTRNNKKDSFSIAAFFIL